MASTGQLERTIVSLANGISVRTYRSMDAEPIAAHANNRKIWDRLRNRMPHPYTVSESESWINMNLDRSKWVNSGPYTPSPNGAPGGTASGEPYPTNYAICINDEPIGAIGFVWENEDDVYARCAEIGYWLGEDHWGKGIMGVVVPAFVDWGWRTFGRLVRMNAHVATDNPGSKRCLEKAGFVVEGMHRLGFVKNGVLCDEETLGMIRPGLMELQSK